MLFNLLSIITNAVARAKLLFLAYNPTQTVTKLIRFVQESFISLSVTYCVLPAVVENFNFTGLNRACTFFFLFSSYGSRLLRLQNNKFAHTYKIEARNYLYPVRKNITFKPENVIKFREALLKLSERVQVIVHWCYEQFLQVAKWIQKSH